VDLEEGRWDCHQEGKKTVRQSSISREVNSHVFITQAVFEGVSGDGGGGGLSR